VRLSKVARRTGVALLAVELGDPMPLLVPVKAGDAPNQVAGQGLKDDQSTV